MKHLTMSNEDKKDNCMDSVIERTSYYYGLKLHIDEDVYKKLELGEAPKVGDEYMVLAKAVVTDVHQDKKSDDIKSTSFALQITDMDLNLPEPVEKKEMTQILYGDKS